MHVIVRAQSCGGMPGTCHAHEDAHVHAVVHAWGAHTRLVVDDNLGRQRAVGPAVEVEGDGEPLHVERVLGELVHLCMPCSDAHAHEDARANAWCMGCMLDRRAL